MRGRESRQPNVSPASLPKVTSEERFRHAASKGCESAGRQQRVGLDLRDGELQVVAECLRLCSRRGGSCRGGTVNILVVDDEEEWGLALM